MNPKRPSILIFTLDYLPNFGGVAMYLYGIARALPKGKISVLADENLLIEKEKPLESHPIVYGKFFSKTGMLKWLPAFKTLSRELHKFDADIIICPNILPLGLVTYFVAKGLGKDYYISLHGLDILLAQKSKRKKMVATFVLKKANAILVNSNYTKSLVKELLGNYYKPIVVIYPCPLEIPTPYNKEEARAEKGYNSDQTIILSVGRLVRRKGFDKVIKLLPGLLKKEPDLKYTIIGDGPEKARLEELIKRFNLEQFVEIHSGVSNDDLKKFYSIADIFAMPNSKLGVDVEGFGLVFLEASLYGLPSIAGNSGGAPEAVRNEKTGLVVDANSQDEIEEALLKLICDPEYRMWLGEQGRSYTQEHFIWRHEVNKIFFCYNNI